MYCQAGHSRSKGHGKAKRSNRLNRMRRTNWIRTRCSGHEAPVASLIRKQDKWPMFVEIAIDISMLAQ